MTKVSTTSEQRVVLRSISWGTYESLLAESEGAGPRLTYIAHAADIRSIEQIDLAIHPPPDLVLEVDLTA